jgi:hypothetical protein
MGINKPLKNRIQHKWEDYMLNEGLIHNQTKPPTCQRLASWCIDSMKEMDEQIVKNAWLHGEYSFFHRMWQLVLLLQLLIHAEMLMGNGKEDEDEVDEMDDEDEMRMAV